MNGRKRIQGQGQGAIAVLDNTLAALPHPLCIINRSDYTVKTANAAALAHGWKPGDKCYNGPHRRSAPCRDCDCECPVDRVAETGAPVIVEHIHYDPSGTPRHVEVHGVPVFDKRGSVKEIIQYVFDVTDRKRLDRDRTLLANAVENSADSTVITDAEGVIQYLNPAFERITGYDRESWFGRSLKELPGMDSAQDFDLVWSTVTQGRSVCANLALCREDGTSCELEATFSALRDDAGLITNIVSVQRDVTHEKALERQLRHAHTMEAVGSLARGIAHDFNNILSVITSFAELTLEGLDRKNPKESYNLSQILAATHRARDLIEQVLTVSSDVPRKPQVIDVASLLREVREFLQASVPHSIEIECPTHTPMHLVQANPGDIHQVLMNLCTNAAFAMRDKGGTLTISLDEYSGAPGAGSRQREFVLPPGEYLHLAVRDTGVGMDREVMERIFEPHFSTKAPGEGNGIGLSISLDIIRKCGGTITVESRVGVGSCFHVYIPRFERVLEQGNIDVPAPAFGSGASILLVDDEPLFVALWKELLEEMGYQVTPVLDSKEALKTFLGRPGTFDLVITDHTMPGMNGAALAREIVSARADIPVLLCTGHREATIPPETLQWIRSTVRKPSRKDELARIIQATLAKDHRRPGFNAEWRG